jgi:hypothetical protein
MKQTIKFSLDKIVEPLNEMLYIVNILYIVTIKENYKKKIATAYSTNKE